MVCEDDAVPEHVFKNGVQSALDEVPSDYHVLLIGCFLCEQPQTDSLSFTMSNHVRRKPRIISKHLRIPSMWYGTHCYIVSKQGARYLTRKFGKVSGHLDVCMGIDTNLITYASNRLLCSQQTFVTGE